MTKAQIQKMLRGEQVLTDKQLRTYREIALCDDWQRMTGSDVRMILGDLIRARAALAKVSA